MKVLCLNPAVSARAYRQMRALSDRGHDVSLLYVGYGRSMDMIRDDFWKRKSPIHDSTGRLSHYPRTLKAATYRETIEKEIARGDYDIIAAYSSPDNLARAATRYSERPVVFDERDMVSAMDPDWLAKNYIPPYLVRFPPVRSVIGGLFVKKLWRIEREASLNSSARVYVSGPMLDLARKRHGIPENNSLVFPNYALKEDIKPRLPKISSEDGGVHVVYEGGLAETGYRSGSLEAFRGLAEKKVHVHIYGIATEGTERMARELDRKNAFFHYHGALGIDSLQSELTRYDWGWIPFYPGKKKNEHLNTILPNKLFEYLAAGLPIISPDLKALKDLIVSEKVGVVVSDLDDIVEKIGDWDGKVDPDRYVIENRIGELEELYRDAIRGG